MAAAVVRSGPSPAPFQEIKVSAGQSAEHLRQISSKLLCQIIRKVTITLKVTVKCPIRIDSRVAQHEI
jgi:hypothetical protein